jgi:hypothetical protein
LPLKFIAWKLQYFHFKGFTVSNIFINFILPINIFLFIRENVNKTTLIINLYFVLFTLLTNSLLKRGQKIIINIIKKNKLLIQFLVNYNEYCKSSMVNRKNSLIQFVAKSSFENQEINSIISSSEI